MGSNNVIVAVFLGSMCYPHSVVNKPRGKEAPAISRQIPCCAMSLLEERSTAVDFEEALQRRAAYGWRTTDISLKDFTNFKQTLRFLQEPSEYIVSLLHREIPDLPGNKEDDKEEGEQDEEDESRSKLTKNRQLMKQAQATDVLCQCFEFVAHLVKFFAGKLKNKDPPQFYALADIQTLKLWIQVYTSPIAFIELVESCPGLCRLMPAYILTLLRIHFQWPLRGGESPLLTKWILEVSPFAVSWDALCVWRFMCMF